MLGIIKEIKALLLNKVLIEKYCFPYFSFPLYKFTYLMRFFYTVLTYYKKYTTNFKV